MLIDNFTGEYSWLSNFHRADVQLDGIIYPTVEHAYQAAKNDDPEYRGRILNCVLPNAAKRMGNKAVLREGWNDVRVQVMEKLLRQKFAIPDLRNKLLDTGEAYLMEGNWWGDTFWGVAMGSGHNQLGKLLMKIRDDVRPKHS